MKITLDLMGNGYSNNRETGVIEIGSIAAKWPKDDRGWSIAPAGLSWIAEGARVRIGDNSSIGNGSILGDGSSIGANSRIGDNSSIGDGSRIGNGSIVGKDSHVGDNSILGDGSSIGDGSRIGNGSSIGNDASWARDIGFADGYRKCIANVHGVAYIGAGCRWFTLAAALRHWDNKQDRIETMCLMQSAIFLAGYHGLAFE